MRALLCGTEEGGQPRNRTPQQNLHRSDKRGGSPMRRLPRPSPALIVSLLALFFALGGTAFAVGSKALVAQPRCAPGAIRGIAVVNGESVQGVGNMSDKYSTDGGLFGYRWSCT